MHSACGRFFYSNNSLFYNNALNIIKTKIQNTAINFKGGVCNKSFKV